MEHLNPTVPATQGQRIHALRKEQRYTQEYLADMLDTTKQAVYKYEKDIVTNIPDRKLVRLAQLLQCSVAYLKCLTDERGTPPAAYLLDNPMPLPAPQTDSPNPGAELLGLLPQLTDPEQQSLLHFAKFLLAQH